MSTLAVLTAGLATGVLAAAGWLATGLTGRWLKAGIPLALTATVGHVVAVAVLSTRGWWFVQGWHLVVLPLLGVAVAAATVLAGPALVRAVRDPDADLPPAASAWLCAVGYAVAAGPVLYLVGGYPLTWGPALITVALAAGAATVTAVGLIRAERSGPSGRGGDGGRELARRWFLGAAGLSVVAGASGVGLSFVSRDRPDLGGGPTGEHLPPDGLDVTTLRGPERPRPGGTVRRHVLTARVRTAALPSGHRFETWSFGDDLGGPLITAEEGDLVETTLRNEDVDEGVTLHWHGYDVACGEDGAPGVTQEAVVPGGEFTQRFLADQVGTYWYHTHQTSHVGVRRGLYGCLVVYPRDGDRADLDLVLPVHTFDGVLVVGESDEPVEHPVQPGQSVRLRLANTDDSPHWLSPVGAPFTLVSVDGRDLHEPAPVTDHSLRIPAGSRYDLLLETPRTPVALLVDHSEVGPRLAPEGVTGDPEGMDRTADWPELDPLSQGAPDPDRPLPDGPFDRSFDLVLDRNAALLDGVPSYAQTVNGLAHPRVPEQLVEEGDLVQFTVANRSFETHPWHLHGHTVRVLSRDGRPPSGGPLLLDTFDVRPGEVWRVAFLADNPGLWMNHCHNLPHADEGMMTRLDYGGMMTPFGDGHGGGH